MFKVDVTNYIIDSRRPDGSLVPVPYDVKDSMATMLLNPQLKLNGTALLRSNVIAEKILGAKYSILLEDAEYEILKRAADGTEGFSRDDVQLIQRIVDAERVQVKVDDGQPDPERNTQEVPDDNA